MYTASSIFLRCAFIMKITIIERESERMSRDSSNSVIQMWEVYQGDMLVGVYHKECEAIQYKVLLESGALNSFSHPFIGDIAKK